MKIVAGEYLNLLGLARKANKLELGEEACTAAARVGKIRAFISASDASEGTRRKTEFLAESSGAAFIPVEETKAELGNALGKRPCAIIGICDIGFAAAIAKKLAPTNEAAARAAEEVSEKAAKLHARKKKSGK